MSGAATTNGAATLDGAGSQNGAEALNGAGSLNSIETLNGAGSSNDAAGARAQAGGEAIAWSASATVGHIAVADNVLVGDLDAGRVDCKLAPAGKFRNGAARWWCMSHQAYWGVNADLARADQRCRAAALPLQMVRKPLLLALPAAAAPSSARLQLTLADGAIAVRGAGIDITVAALAITHLDGVYRHPAITRVNVTPPALAAMAHADGCVDCARCGYPHLDLGPFAVRAHRRHTCGQCGHDSTHSSVAIVSNPLYLLRHRLTLVP